MDKYDAVTDLDLIAGRVRQLADLMLVWPHVQDLDYGAFALVLHELARRLERATGELQSAGHGPYREQGGRP